MEIIKISNIEKVLENAFDRLSKYSASSETLDMSKNDIVKLYVGINNSIPNPFRYAETNCKYVYIAKKMGDKILNYKVNENALYIKIDSDTTIKFVNENYCYISTKDIVFSNNDFIDFPNDYSKDFFEYLYGIKDVKDFYKTYNIQNIENACVEFFNMINKGGVPTQYIIKPDTIVGAKNSLYTLDFYTIGSKKSDETINSVELTTTGAKLVVETKQESLYSFDLYEKKFSYANGTKTCDNLGNWQKVDDIPLGITNIAMQILMLCEKNAKKINNFMYVGKVINDVVIAEYDGKVFATPLNKCEEIIDINALLEEEELHIYSWFKDELYFYKQQENCKRMYVYDTKENKICYIATI